MTAKDALRLHFDVKGIYSQILEDFNVDIKVVKPNGSFEFHEVSVSKDVTIHGCRYNFLHIPYRRKRLLDMYDHDKLFFWTLNHDLTHAVLLKGWVLALVGDKDSFIFKDYGRGPNEKFYSVHSSFFETVRLLTDS